MRGLCVSPAPEESLTRMSHASTAAADFERERDTMLATIEQYGVQQEELHRLEWENMKRAEEIRELQKVLASPPTSGSTLLPPVLPHCCRWALVRIYAPPAALPLTAPLPCAPTGAERGAQLFV